MISYLQEMNAPTGMIEMQEAAGSSSAIFLTAAQLVETRSDAGLDEPPPPRRRPSSSFPRYYEPPPPPPGTIFIPAERRVMPCLPTVLTFGVLRFCI